MKITREVTWDTDVFPCWRRSANNAPRPNSDVWRPLPSGIRWFEAELEETDIDLLYLIGSADLMQTFGSYRICRITRSQEGQDEFNHRNRIRAIVAALRRDQHIERPILVGDSALGPFVIIDGNHRCLAHHVEQRVVGLKVYCGVVAGLLRGYCWARQALTATVR